MPFNDMIVRWIDILGQLAHGTAMVGYLIYQIPEGYDVPHLSAIRTGEFLTPQSENSSENRRTLSLSLKKFTELYEISNGFTRKDWVGVGF